MLRRYVGLCALSVAPALALFACSSDDSGDGAGGTAGGTGATGGTGGAGGTGGSGGSDEGVGRVAPAAPSGPTTAGGNPTALAISKLHFGDRSRTGEPSNQAWKEFGYNLDGLLSHSGSTQHCTPSRTANPSIVKTDGNEGIDNGFGAGLVPILLTVPTATDDINTSIQNGEFTVIVTADLGPETETTATGIAAKLHAGAFFGSLLPICATTPTTPPTPPTDPSCFPKFDGSDVWPLAPELTTNNPLTVDFPSSFMVDGTWVSGGKGTIAMTIALGGIEFTMTITEALVVMDVTGRGSSASATNGTIAGVIDTELLISELRKVAGSVDPSLCEGSAFDAIAGQIREVSDIMKDGTNGDPSKTCDAISVGLGFDAKGITLGEVAPPVVQPPDPCAATP